MVVQPENVWTWPLNALAWEEGPVSCWHGAWVPLCTSMDRGWCLFVLGRASGALSPSATWARAGLPALAHARPADRFQLGEARVTRRNNDTTGHHGKLPAPVAGQCRVRRCAQPPSLHSNLVSMNTRCLVLGKKISWNCKENFKKVRSHFLKASQPLIIMHPRERSRSRPQRRACHSIRARKLCSAQSAHDTRPEVATVSKL